MQQRSFKQEVPIRLEAETLRIRISQAPRRRCKKLLFFSWISVSSFPTGREVQKDDLSRAAVSSQLHGLQVTTGRNRVQHALRQTLGLLHGAATAGPVRLPRVSFMAVTAAFKPACRQERQEGTGSKQHLHFFVKCRSHGVTQRSNSFTSKFTLK